MCNRNQANVDDCIDSPTQLEISFPTRREEGGRPQESFRKVIEDEEESPEENSKDEHPIDIAVVPNPSVSFKQREAFRIEMKARPPEATVHPYPSDHST